MTKDNQVAVITGAAQGVGRTVAQQLGRAGNSLVINDIQEEKLESVRAELSDEGFDVTAVVADVGVAGDVNRLIKSAEAAYGRIDVLVNNAVAYGGVEESDINVESTPDGAWDRTFAVNFYGAVWAIRDAIPVMLRGGGGSIVNVGSTSGLRGDTVHVAYAASMAAKYSLTRSVATSHGKRGIRVNSVASGLILSPTAKTNLSSEKLAAYDANLLVNDFGETEDLASVICFLAGPGAKYITGQTITVDGGFHAHQPWHAQNDIVHPQAPV
ncbi:SDR family NAD(P)-dependent oxidoreductase [Williamsia soli]|uniref:SDR family NAD(P)-dependent oxidoreductase n=1 Tax=Williamsia soli TaxID=364929 RepID=UPI001A9DCF86|nr:SDR family oxidoreductase [Williamsia soli]